MLLLSERAGVCHGVGQGWAESLDGGRRPSAQVEVHAERRACAGRARWLSSRGGLPNRAAQLLLASRMPQPADEAGSVLHKQIFWLSLWYACSGGTLFLNKIILTQLNGDIQILGCCQMGMTAVLGAAKVYGGRYLCGDAAPVTKYSGDAESERVAYSAFRRNMLLVAVMRSSTILLGTPPALSPRLCCFRRVLALTQRTRQALCRLLTSRHRSPRRSKPRPLSSPWCSPGSSCARPRARRST